MCVSDLPQSAEYEENSEEDFEGASEDDVGGEKAGEEQQVHQELLEKRGMKKDWQRLRRKHRKEWQELHERHGEAETDTKRREVLEASGEVAEHLWQALQKERDDLERRQQDEIDALLRQHLPPDSGSGDGTASDEEVVLDFSFI